MTWPPKVTQLNISSYYNSREENFIKENSWGKQGCCSVAQLCLTLWLHGLQQARPPCPALSSGVCPNSCPLNQWCYPTISSSDAPFSFCFQSFPASASFPMNSAVPISWPKYWSFSTSPSNECSVLISFRIDWFDLLAVQGILKSLLQHQFKSINSSLLSLLYGPTLTYVHDSGKTTAFSDHCGQNDVSCF